MKLLIVGSRSIRDFDLEGRVPSEIETIISGGADGVDTLAEQYADRHRLSKIIMRPQYQKYGRGAPLKRNDEMVDLCDRVLLIWDGKSKGTQHTLRYAQKKQKPIEIILVETP